MFISKAEEPTKERSFTPVGSGLARKHQTMLENLYRDQLSSLFGQFESHEEKSFTTFAPWCHTQRFIIFVT